jgi:hypothetical protein
MPRLWKTVGLSCGHGAASAITTVATAIIASVEIAGSDGRPRYPAMGVIHQRDDAADIGENDCRQANGSMQHAVQAAAVPAPITAAFAAPLLLDLGWQPQPGCPAAASVQAAGVWVTSI